MVSSRSMKPFIWALSLLSFIRAIPATWGPINSCLVLKYGKSYQILFSHLRRPQGGFIWAGIYLLIQVLNILYLILFILVLEHSRMDLYIASFLLACFILATFVQLLIVFFNFEGFVSIINSFFILDLKIRKFNKKRERVCPCSK